MYEINYTSTSGDDKTIRIINRDYAFSTFMRLADAVDLVSLVMIDGLTGELIHEFRDGDFTVMGGVVR